MSRVSQDDGILLDLWISCSVLLYLNCGISCEKSLIYSLVNGQHLLQQWKSKAVKCVWVEGKTDYTLQSSCFD